MRSEENETKVTETNAVSYKGFTASPGALKVMRQALTQVTDSEYELSRSALIDHAINALVRYAPSTEEVFGPLFSDQFHSVASPVLSGRHLAALSIVMTEVLTNATAGEIERARSQVIRSVVNAAHRMTDAPETVLLPGAVKFLLREGGFGNMTNHRDPSYRMMRVEARCGRYHAVKMHPWLGCTPVNSSEHERRIYTFFQTTITRERHSTESRFRFEQFKRRLKDLTSYNSWSPGRLTQLRPYVGLEIECVVEDVEPATQACGCCDGMGTVMTYDRHDNEYENTCMTCDGDGTVEGDEYDSEAGVEKMTSHLDYEVEGIKRTSVTYDSSIDGVGAEIRHCYAPSLAQDRDLMRRVVSAAAEIASVNKSCGLHVHLSIAKDSPQRPRAERAFRSWLPLMVALVSQSRKQDGCYNQLRVDDNKYSAVNTGRDETIEVRLHQGTLDPDKIECWVTLLQAIATSTRNYRPGLTQSEYLALLGINNQRMRSYLAERIAKHAPGSIPIERQLALSVG